MKIIKKRKQVIIMLKMKKMMIKVFQEKNQKAKNQIKKRS